MRVLVYTSPARGHLYPVVPIVQELQRRGHELALRTLASQVELMRSLGVDAAPISAGVEAIELDDYEARSIAAKAKRALATFLARAEPEAPDLAGAIADHDPQLLLIDVNCWGAAIVAEASGLPWAMYAPYVLPLPSRDLPPFGPGLAPARGPLGRARDALLRRIGNTALQRQALPPLRALRARHGLEELRRWSELFERPGLTLALTAEGFEYPRSDWPANVRMVGAINWDPPTPPSLRSEPPWLAEMHDPLVLVTCSTELQHDRRLIRVALDALPPQGMSVLATAGAHDPSAFTAPPGSRVERFVPHAAVLARAACVVCHGGMGITQKALSAAVPVVVVPFGRDQLETARRVELAEAGVRLSPRRLTPERLAAAVHTAQRCHPGARRVSLAYKAAGGATTAADEIESLGRVHSAHAARAVQGEKRKLAQPPPAAPATNGGGRLRAARRG